MTYETKDQTNALEKNGVKVNGMEKRKYFCDKFNPGFSCKTEKMCGTSLLTRLIISWTKLCIWNGKLFHNLRENSKNSNVRVIEPHRIISVDMSFLSSVSPQSLTVNQLLVKLTEFSFQTVNVLTCLKRQQGP